MRVNIANSWYHSAGTQYGWLKDGYDRRGVGIEAGLFKGRDEIEVVVDKVEYLLKTIPAVEFIKKYKSYHNAKGTSIGVVSKSLLTKKKEEEKKVPKQKLKVEKQLILFKGYETLLEVQGDRPDKGASRRPNSKHRFY